MSRLFQFVSLIGWLLLAVIVILAILSLTGSFDPKFTNPPS